MSNITNLIRAAKAAPKPTVVALHCSGANGSQWRQLGQDLGHGFSLIAPNLLGPGDGADRFAGRAFRLTDEAAQVVRIIDLAKRPVHLVGHSYGGAVAMRAAIERPSQIASLTLYEPSAFHVIRGATDEDNAFAEIRTLAGDVNRFVSNGDLHAAAMRFVGYWNGTGAWEAMRAEARDQIVRYIPKACLEFAAAIGERTPLIAYRRLYFPILLLQGEHAPEPSRLIARRLARAMRFVSLQTVYGAGHMGPFSHAPLIGAMIADWIKRAQSQRPIAEHDLQLDLDRVA